MAEVYLFASDGGVTVGGPELLEAPLAPGAMAWIDVEGQTPEHEALIQGMGFHPLAVEDTFTLQHQPKLEEYEDCLFLIIRGLDFNRKSERLETLKLAAFLTTGRLVTFHKAPMRSVATIKRKMAETGKPPRGGLAHLLYMICDEIIDHYFPVLEQMSSAIETVEEEIFEEPRQEHLEAVLQMRRRLSTLRRVMLPHREVFSHLATGATVQVETHDALYFRDVYDQVMRLVDAADQQRDQLAGVRDTYLSLVSQRTNDVMKVLTVISAVLLPLTVVAGIYGMNFTHMPELASPYGYPVVLTGMALLVVGMVVWFKRRGWL